MSINPIDENATPDPTGSLEELFRHHLGQEAAAPVRPMLWDQIDNSLLIRQNELYRRRLTATRWVAAASLLLATLACTGWWARRDAAFGGGAEVATAITGRRATDAAAWATAGARPANGSAASGSGSQSAGARHSQGLAEAQTTSVAASGLGVGQGAVRSSLSERAGMAAMETGETNPTGSGFAETSAAFAPGRPAASALVARTGRAARPSRFATAKPAATPNGTVANGRTSAASAMSLAATSLAATMPVTPAVTPLPMAAAEAAEAAATSVATGTTATEVAALAARSAALALLNGADLPGGLAPLPLPEPEPTVAAHRWSYSARYAAGSFNPNLNFSRTGIEPEYDYNPALGHDSPAITETAAAEYRANLRPGLSQRLAVMATRHLRGHWHLSTGAEFGQATASSASTSSFVGEQLLDVGQSAAGPMRRTNFRYRVASVPVEVRYANPLKRGWSLYGRVGGAVSALLGVRSEVEGNPEATKTYSLLSAGTPYRRVLATVHGGAGAQFASSTGKWTFSLGPVAELGLLSLNAHPTQGYLSQSRPYSVGLEAGVEFGR